MTKVADATTADGSTGWFKIFEDSWAAVVGSGDGTNDDWGTKDLNNCCGRMAVKIPSDIPAGDYLLRAEVIALHVAGSVGGAQFYMSCCKFTCFLPMSLSWSYILKFDSSQNYLLIHDFQIRLQSQEVVQPAPEQSYCPAPIQRLIPAS
jgi:hypothetical protein